MTSPMADHPADEPAARPAARPADPLSGPLSDLLARPRPGPFALLRREGRDRVEVLAGEIEIAETLAGVPVGDPARPGAATLAVVPYRQITERGFEAVDDGAPLRCLRIRRYAEVTVAEALAALPSDPPVLVDGGFDIADDEYERVVRDVLRDEIGHGAGSNFVIHRTYTAGVAGDPLAAALATFGRLLRAERGAYWTFLVHTGEGSFVGASPERHVSVDDGLVMMNPISGTYRHPTATGPAPDRPSHRDGLLRFLADPKETDELYMVLDEELKMMATVADLGGHVVGPYLKEMAHLTHTEYLLAGRGSRDVRDVLRETMFAPTVVGSPIENACRVIARHERRGRGYYGGVLALLGHDAQGRQTLDAPILIRCAEFDADGRLRVPVGATLVRHSVPRNEVAETHAKARGVLAALGVTTGNTETPAGSVPPAPGGPAGAEPGGGLGGGLAADPEVRRALAARNATLARFWLAARDPEAPPLAPELAGRRVLVVDAEDTFTGMLVHQLRTLGLAVTLCSHRDAPDPGGYHLLVAGPGPGDPGDLGDDRIAALRGLVRTALRSGQPLLGVCLGHQVLAATLGLPLLRKEIPYQGVQRTIDFFGRPERVGFYSTFTAMAARPVFDTRYGTVTVSRDPASREVHALRGPTFAGVQFHAESVLSEHGVDLLRELVAPLVSADADAGVAGG